MDKLVELFCDVDDFCRAFVLNDNNFVAKIDIISVASSVLFPLSLT